MTDASASADRKALEKKAEEIFDDVLVTLSRDMGGADKAPIEVPSVEGADSFFESPPRRTLGHGGDAPASVNSPQALAVEIATLWSAAGSRELEELAERLQAFANEVPEGFSEETSEVSTNVYVMY